MSRAALFVTVKNWKQPKCPLMTDDGKLLSNKKE